MPRPPTTGKRRTDAALTDHWSPPMPTVANPKVVAVLGLGAMGAGVAGDLRASGFDVISTADGRSGQSRERAAKANVRLLESLAAVVDAADTFLSIVPADQAEPLAESIAGALK